MAGLVWARWRLAALAGGAGMLAAGVMLFSGAAHAQEGPKSLWSVPCDGEAGAIDCRVTQTLFVKGTRQLVLAVSVRRPEKGKDPAMLLHLPHGLFLPAGATLQIDDAKPERLDIQTCDQRGCYAGAPLPKAMIDRLSKGKQLSVAVQDTNKRPVTIAVELAGFAEAMAKLP